MSIPPSYFTGVYFDSILEYFKLNGTNKEIDEYLDKHDPFDFISKPFGSLTTNHTTNDRDWSLYHNLSIILSSIDINTSNTIDTNNYQRSNDIVATDKQKLFARAIIYDCDCYESDDTTTYSVTYSQQVLERTSNNAQQQQQQQYTIILKAIQFYFNQMHYAWSVIQELLKIENDSDHQYYNSAKIYLNEVKYDNKSRKQCFYDSFMSYINTAYSCRRHNYASRMVDTQLNNRCEDSINQATIRHSTRVIELALETILILLSGNRKQYVTMSFFSSMLKLAMEHGFSRPDIAADTDDKIEFKYILIFMVLLIVDHTECDNIHPLLDDVHLINATAVADNNILTFIDTMTGSIGSLLDIPASLEIVEEDNAFFVLKVLWYRFRVTLHEKWKIPATAAAALDSVAVSRFHNDMINEKKAYDAICVDCVSWIVKIVIKHTGISNNVDINSHTNGLYFDEVTESQDMLESSCLIIQKTIYNILMDTAVVRMHDYLDGIVTLCKASYRNKKYLCIDFHQQLKLRNENNPLVKLLVDLQRNLLKDRLYQYIFLSLLQATTCVDNDDVSHFLYRQIDLYSWEQLENIYTGSRNKLGTRDVVQYQCMEQKGYEQVGRSYPVYGNKGIVIEIVDDADQYLVKWNAMKGFRTTCWYYMIDKIYSLQKIIADAAVFHRRTKQYKKDKQQRKVNEADVDIQFYFSNILLSVDIISNLISSRRISTIAWLNKVLEEHDLYMLLQDIDVANNTDEFVKCYDALAKTKDLNAFISSMLCNSSTDVKKKLVKAGIAPGIAAKITHEVYRYPIPAEKFVATLVKLLHCALDNILYSDRPFPLAVTVCCSIMRLLSMLSNAPSVWPTYVSKAIILTFNGSHSLSDMIGRLNVSLTVRHSVDLDVYEQITYYSLLLNYHLLKNTSSSVQLHCNSNPLWLFYDHCTNSNARSDNTSSITYDQLFVALQKRQNYTGNVGTVRQLFNHLPQHDEGCVSYSDLVRLVNMTYSSDGNSSNVLGDEVEGLLILLQGIAYPDGYTAIDGRSALELSMIQQTVLTFSQMEKSYYSKRVSQWTLATVCFNIFQAVVEGVKDKQRCQARRYLLTYIQSNPSFLGMVFQMAVIPGLSALQSKRCMTKSSRLALMKDKYLTHAIIPINFKYGIYGNTDNEIHVVNQMTMKAMHFIDTILGIDDGVIANDVIAALLGPVQSMNFLNPPPGAATRSVEGLTVDEDLVYIAIVAAMLKINININLDIVEVYKTQTYAAKLLNKVINIAASTASTIASTTTSGTNASTSSSSSTQSRLISSLRLANMPGLVEIIIDSVSDDNSLPYYTMYRVALLDLLVTIGTVQPMLLSLLFQVPCKKPSLSTLPFSNNQLIFNAKPEDSALLSMIIDLLRVIESKYTQHQLLYCKLLKLVISMWKHTANVGALKRVVEYLLKVDRFWDYVTYPLTQCSTNAAAATAAAVDAEYGALNIDNLEEYLIHLKSSDMIDYPPPELARQCSLLLSMSLSLELLSFMRYDDGKDLADATATASNKVDEVYRKLTSQHWMRDLVASIGLNQHYHQLVCRLENKNKLLAIDITHTYCNEYSNSVAVGSCSSSSSDPVYRKFLMESGFIDDNYPVMHRLFTVAPMFQQIHSVHELCSCEVRVDSKLGSIEDCKKEREGTLSCMLKTKNLWLEYMNEVNQVGHHWAIADAMFKLLHSCNVFCEVHTSSMPAIETYRNRRILHSGSGGRGTDLTDSTGFATSGISGTSSSKGGALYRDEDYFAIIEMLIGQLSSDVCTVNVTELSCKLSAERSDFLLTTLYHQLYHFNDVPALLKRPSVRLYDSKCIGAYITTLIDILNISCTIFDGTTGKQQVYTSLQSTPIIRMHVKQMKLNVLSAVVVLLSFTTAAHGKNMSEYSSEVDRSIYLGFSLALQTLRDELVPVRPAAEHAAVCQKTMKMSVQLMKAALEYDSGTDSSTFSASMTADQGTIVASLHSIMSCVANERAAHTVPDLLHDYQVWDVSTEIGSDGDPIAVYNSYKIDNTSIDEIDTNQFHVLHGLIDILFIGVSKKTVKLEALVNDRYSLLGLLIYGTVFKRYQEVLQSCNNASKVSSIMAYTTLSGDVSIIYQCWRRLLDLLSLVVSMTDFHNVNDAKHLDVVARIFDNICNFLNMYTFLLLAPYHHNSRYSLQQTKLLVSTAAFFNLITKHMPSWRSKQTQLYKLLNTNVCQSIAAMSTIMYHDNLFKSSGTSSDTALLAMIMFHHVIAVSSEERYSISNHIVEFSPVTKKDKKSKGNSSNSSSSSSSSSSGGTRSRGRSGSGSKNNMRLDAYSNSAYRSRSGSSTPDSQVHRDTENVRWKHIDDLYMEVTDSFIDVLNQLLAYIRTISTSPFDYDRNGDKYFDEGTSVYYIEHDHILEGVVVCCQNEFIQVQTTLGGRIWMETEQVCYIRKPMVMLEPYVQHKHDGRDYHTDRPVSVGEGMMITTKHLIYLMHCYMSMSKDRHGISSVSIMGALTSIILLKNLCHHALSDVNTHIVEEQLMLSRRLIAGFESDFLVKMRTKLSHISLTIAESCEKRSSTIILSKVMQSSMHSGMYVYSKGIAINPPTKIVSINDNNHIVLSQPTVDGMKQSQEIAFFDDLFKYKLYLLDKDMKQAIEQTDSLQYIKSIQ